MKRMIIILLPLVAATLAVIFALYKNTTLAEDLSVSSGAAQYNASGEAQYSRTNDEESEVGINSAPKSTVPRDIYYTKTVESVVFSHQTHAGELELKCDTCHGGLFQMKAKSVESQPDFNMAGLAKGKYCGSCHSAKSETAFSSDTQCARCHRGVKGLERQEVFGNKQED